ncbi:hypothetical protein LTR08_002089 [Meristemomyces frigidus]|nr:hypothetical protein LTR08_002089 [Meristemomyces frigidus]
MANLAGAFAQMRIPREPQQNHDIPTRQLLRARASVPAVPQPKLLLTEKAVYEVLQSVDPRAQDRTDTGMSDGVNLIRNAARGTLYVEKRIKVVRESRRQRALAEIAVLTQVRDAGGSYATNTLVESFWDRASSYCHIILEYCNQGALDGTIDRYVEARHQVPEDFCWHVLTGLTKALCFIHSGLDLELANAKPRPGWNTICHLDIKPGNIFLTSTGQTGGYPRVVLGDFGCAVTWNDIRSGKESREILYQGTEEWMPPELEPNDHGIVGKYGMPTDVWQMGGVIQVVCRLMDVPDQESVGRNRPCGRAYSKDLNNMVCSVMHKEYAKRPRAIDMVGELKRLMRTRRLVF